jgi:hypothetical protein
MVCEELQPSVMAASNHVGRFQESLSSSKKGNRIMSLPASVMNPKKLFRQIVNLDI